MVSQNITQLIEQERFEQALDLLNQELAAHPCDDSLLFTRGRLYWRLGKQGAAISDYEAALAINPDSPAAIALAQARSVMDFFNPDIFNP